MGSESLHEPRESLSAKTLDLHRAIVSLMEELEAVDWYRQRADATSDEALKAVLLHNMREEIEHAMMNLEWIRRNEPTFDEHARTYLFTDAPITEVEESATSGDGGGESGSPAARTSTAGGGGSLGIGSLKGKWTY